MVAPWTAVLPPLARLLRRGVRRAVFLPKQPRLRDGRRRRREDPFHPQVADQQSCLADRHHVCGYVAAAALFFCTEPEPNRRPGCRSREGSSHALVRDRAGEGRRRKTKMHRSAKLIAVSPIAPRAVRCLDAIRNDRPVGLRDQVRWCDAVDALRLRASDSEGRHGG